MKSICPLVAVSAVTASLVACGGGATEATGPTSTSSVAATAPPTVTSAPPTASSTPSAPPKHFAGGKAPAPVKPAASSKDPGDTARYVAITTDENDDPGVAFVSLGDKDGTEDSALYFSAWDPAAGAFTEPKQVAVMGSRNGIGNYPISLAYDAETHTFAIAFQSHATKKFQSALDIAFSTDHGATWHDHTVLDSKDQVHFPIIAMSRGTALVACTRAGKPVYASGSEKAEPSSWSIQSLPDMGDHKVKSDMPPSLAIDSAGNPAFAYWTAASNSYQVAFYRPKSNQPQTALETKNEPPQRGLFLGFAGTSPRVVAQAKLDIKPEPSVHYVSTTSNDGTTWTPPVPVGSDKSEGEGLTFFAAISPTGRGAIIYDPNTGGGSEQCGKPKLASTTDFKSWSTCSPDADGSQHYAVVATSVAAGFDTKGRSLAAFSVREPNNAPTKTIWVYRID